ncbi:MAG: methyltransferase [Marmoricola sp.]
MTNTRPLERRNAARTAVVWDALAGALAEAPGSAVLDIGGGTGGLAVRMAGAGHRVTVVDPSPDALAAASRRAAEDGVGERVTGVQGELADLPRLVGPGTVDVVLCHGVLGLVPDPAAALRTVSDLLVPGGLLSLVVAQRHAVVLARAMAGHLREAKELLEGGDLPVDERRGSERRFDADQARALMEAAGLVVLATHGVRVFVDLVPSALLDAEPGSTEALVELERAAAERPEMWPLASQLHLLARKEPAS